MVDGFQKCISPQTKHENINKSFCTGTPEHTDCIHNYSLISLLLCRVMCSFVCLFVCAFIFFTSSSSSSSSQSLLNMYISVMEFAGHAYLWTGWKKMSCVFFHTHIYSISWNVCIVCRIGVLLLAHLLCTFQHIPRVYYFVCTYVRMYVCTHVRACSRVLNMHKIYSEPFPKQSKANQTKPIPS